MSLPKFEVDVRIISKLADEPNDVGGLSAEEFKGKFDEAPELIKSYINETLIPQIESDIEAAAKGVSAGGNITGEMLAPGSVAGSKLTDGAVNTVKIADDAVTSRKIAQKTIVAANIADKTISAQQIADKGIFREQIADEAISADKIFPGAVGNNKIAAQAVSLDKIATELRTQYFTVNVPAEWSGDSAPFHQTIANETLTNMRSIDFPKGYFWAPEKIEDLEVQQEAFSLLCGIESADGAVTLKVKEKPDVEFSVLVEAIRI